MTIIDALGSDITRPMLDGAALYGIPAELALACAIAESSLNPQAERYGRETLQAKQSIANGDRATLQAIITRAGSDISFGLSQTIIRYHYHGDRTATVSNVLAVREYVFTHEAEDIDQMCKLLAARRRLSQAASLSPTGGNLNLMTLTAYNHGSPPPVGDPYWTERASTVQRYREALTQAAAMLAEQPKEEDMGKLEDMAAAGTLIGGARWPNADQPLPVVDIRDEAGNGFRLMWLTDGIAMEADNGDVYQPVEGSPVSLARVVTNTMRARPDDFRAALAELGFQIVPG